MDDQFLIYNALDSACMMEIHNQIWPKVQEEYQKTYQLTERLFRVVMAMQQRGMLVDHASLEDTKLDILTEREEKQNQLNAICGRPLNVNSPKDCCSYFYIERGLPVILNKDSQTASVDNKALQRMVRGTAKNPSVPEAKLVQDIRGLSKLYNTYLNAVFDEDSRLRGSYNLRGTKFGRLSSSKTIEETGLNYQNLPQEFKKFLIADEGYILLEADKRQAEWVVVAYLANDANMLRAIRENLDVHSYTASLMFNLPIEVIKYESTTVGHATSADEIEYLRMHDDFLKKIYTKQWSRTGSLRQCGKKANHGLNYGEGPNNFALINEMEIAEAKRVVEMYHRIYPSIHLWHEAVKKKLQQGRMLENCFGRKVLFMGDLGEDMYKAAYAMLPQSTVVDSVNEGMVRIYQDSSLTKEANIDLLAQVHDSILLQIPISVAKDKERMEEVKRKIAAYMSPTLSYAGGSFSIETDMKVGKNWGERREKSNPAGMRDFSSFEDIKKLLEV